MLGWSSAVNIDTMLGDDSLGAGVWLLLWVAAVLISILVHEIGHWLAMRWYGTDAYVVLYHFGGLAVPRGKDGGRREAARRSEDQRSQQRKPV